MPSNTHIRFRSLFAAVAAFVGVHCSADDWPQYQGLHRDGRSAETGLARSWPADGPPEVWQQPVGPGYGGAAVRDGEDFVKATVDRYRVARDTVHQRLGAMRRVHLPPPEAAFYAFFEVDGMGDAAEFAKEILLKTKVGLAPGTAFGAGGDNYLRICYAKSPALLGEALDRLATVLD